jgi:diacylglycerol kinase family enzyme
MTGSCSTTLHFTDSAGHAQMLTRAVLDLAQKDVSESVLFLIVTAGGDGTSLEVQTELADRFLIENHRSLEDRVCLLRLPFGTGNDGSDGRTVDQSLSLLTGKSVFDRQSAVRVVPYGKERSPWYAFNIVSIGLDAFVTHMTNHVKGVLPGDFYKIWVDVACLFYNRIFHIGNMTATATAKDGTIVKRHTDPMLLYVMGVTGSRTYGSNQKILPDANNVCGAKEMPLMRKLVLKKHVKNGTHAAFPEIMLYSADRVVFDYDGKILIQLDGESHMLTPSDFPLVFELTEPFINVLKPAL